MKAIPYKQEFFDLVSQLTPINNSIVIDFDEESKRITIKTQDSEKTTAYVLSVPHEYLGIDEKIGFYRYSEFYRFLKTLNNPNVAINQNKLTLSKDGSKFTYILNDTSRMKSGPNNINMPDPDFKFILDSESLMEIVKMHTLIKDSKHTQFTCVGDTVSIKVCMTEGDNSFEKTFKTIISNESFIDEPLQFNIFSDFFTKLPPRQDYTISIKDPGHLIFELKSEDMKLKLYTANLKKRTRGR